MELPDANQNNNQPLQQQPIPPGAPPAAPAVPAPPAALAPPGHRHPDQHGGRHRDLQNWAEWGLNC